MNRALLYIAYLGCMFMMNKAQAQENLIPNPSFEEHSSCPLQNELGQGEFNKCISWWYSVPPTIGTPDYFNKCNDSIGGPDQGIVGIPGNFWGYQPAYNGNAYVGCVLFDYYIPRKIIESTEPIECKLKQPLQACGIYKFSAWVNLANLSSVAIARIGITLTKDSLVIDSLEANFAIQPNWENTVPLTDTVNWVEIGGTFTAKGGEQYLTIGCFYYYHPDQVVFTGDSNSINVFDAYGSYYYIDEVSLVKVGTDETCQPQLPNVFTPNGDGINDVYTIANSGVQQLFIYNRWGTKITTLTPQHPTWNGKYHDRNCSDGTYYYIGSYNGNKLKGTITLIR